MEIEKKREKQHNLLERINNELQEAGLISQIDVETVPGTDRKVEICRLLTDDPEFNDNPMTAEFFFIETEASAPDIIYFTAMITLRDDEELVRNMQLVELLTMLNQSMPFGAFKFDMDKGLLTYRLDAVYNATVDDDAIYPHLTATAANMLSASEMFSPIVLDVCDEEISIYEAMRILKLGSFAKG